MRLRFRLAVVLLACFVASVGCGKKDLLRLNADAITSLTAALQSADAAYRSGFLSADAQRGILTGGEAARKSLVALNEFAQAYPEGALPTEEAKTKALTVVNEAIAQVNALVEQGVFFTSPDAQKAYYRYIRPAQAMVLAIRTAIIKINTLKPKPALQAQACPTQLSPFNSHLHSPMTLCARRHALFALTT